MSTFNARNIQSVELAERIRSSLDDFRDEGMLSAQGFRKKSTFVSVLTAINHADRLVCRDMHLTGVVVVYVPAGETNVIFEHAGDYAGEIVDDLVAQGVEGKTRTEAWFLTNHNYIYVLEILDRYVYGFGSYPASGEKSETRLRKVSNSEYQRVKDRFRKGRNFFFGSFYGDGPQEGLCWFDVDQGRLVLGQAFTDPAFLQFRARIMPGILNVSDIDAQGVESEDWRVYKPMAPHYAFELMLREALNYMIPDGAGEAWQTNRIKLEDERRAFRAQRSVDRNVVVPKHSFG